MNPGEYAAMARVERDHWWYRGLRDAYVRVLERPATRFPANPRILDAGCGTGENLRALAEQFAPSYLGGFDHASEALEFAAAKAPSADVYQGDICDPEIRASELDLVISLDVVYIPGSALAFDGLTRLVHALRPGGLMLLNLPAYDWLYSQHDVAIHTSERYTAKRVRKLLERLGLEVELLTYRLCLLFPAVVAARVPGKLKARRGDRRAQSDLHSPPGGLVNRTFYAAVALENRWIARGVPLPFGSSVFALARRP